MSIVTARSPTTVNARMANGVSPSNATAPAVPLISAGRTKGANLRDLLGAAQFERSGAPMGARHDVGVQYRDQSLKVALAGGSEVGVDDGPLTSQVGVRRRRGAADPASGPAGKLPGRLGRALDQHGDLVERNGEHVVQHEREAFCRTQSVENDLQRDPDGVGEQGFVLGIVAGVGRDDRLGRERVERLLGM